MNEDFLDNEEQELVHSYDTINISAINPPSKEEQSKFKEAADKFVKKETKMNIRIDPLELEKIKEIASNEGLKYQTFVKSILHKYITGQLVEKRKIS